MMENLHSRFQGCFMGLAVGDALGGHFESQSEYHMSARFESWHDVIRYPFEDIWYTDDTQMALGVAEALVADGEIKEKTLCKAFAENYLADRGYGRGARKVLEAMQQGRDYQTVAQTTFPGGSYGNGGAMRVAPLGIFYRDDHEKLWHQAELSARPTHVHPLGIEGTQLLALAVALASKEHQFDRDRFFGTLIKACVSDTFGEKLESAAQAQCMDDVSRLGNGIEAHESVPTAMACFALYPDSYDQAVGQAIMLGGDTDTIAAMAGAISGAYLGLEKIPRHLVDFMEKSPKGGAYIMDMSDQLFQKYQERAEKNPLGMLQEGS